LDAQRETAEAFIQSQRREGWIAFPEFYDDWGVGDRASGSAEERIALREIGGEFHLGAASHPIASGTSCALGSAQPGVENLLKPY